MKKFFLLTGLVICLYGFIRSSQKNDHPANEKIENLIEQMTLEEKIGQMTQICFSTITEGAGKALNLDEKLARKAISEYHVGSFLSGSGTAKEWVDFVTKIQQLAKEESRLQIPLLIGIDHVHGANYVQEGTFLPHNLLLSCSFDPEIVKKAADITASETAPLGIHWNFAPVLDVGINPVWPRLYETFGEDPLVCGILGSTFIENYQQAIDEYPYKLSACAKHFIGYSDPKSGWDRTPAEISDQQLFEYHLPPFKEAVNSGVKTIMVNSGEVNGIPVHRSEKMLKDILRTRLEFRGVILTDIKDIQKIVEMHYAAENEKEATLMAIQAGIDMSMTCNSYNFCNIVKELVEENKITEERIDESVRRILTLKQDLGLFINPFPVGNVSVIGSDKHKTAARKIAEESIVLLKNDGILPLNTDHKKILITGIAANSRKMLNGAWTLEWLGAEEESQPQDMNTIYTSFRKHSAAQQIDFLQLDSLDKNKNKDLLTEKIDESDIVCLTLGEQPYSEFKGNINDLNLPENQREILEFIVSKRKPVILILIEGRPRIITTFNDKVNAILFAGYPGKSGGDALFNVITGKVNPSGKLSFTYPGSPNHTTPYYHKKSDSYIALYPFGHGLSYSQFRLQQFTVTDSIIHHPNDTITASIQVKNIGNIDGKETILWYIQDERGRITRPVKQLKHFEKKMIKAGATITFKFNINPSDCLSYIDSDHPDEKIIEPGTFVLMVGDLKKKIYYQPLVHSGK